MLKVTLVSHTPNPMDAMAQAAAECYDSKPNAKVVDACIKSGHHSVTEFADFHFRVEGLSRIVSQQLTRHRMASFAQRSQRYCLEDHFTYAIPHTIVNNKRAAKMYLREMHRIQITYDKLIKEEIPAEDARYVLPNAIDTSLHVKMNFRELMHFCNVRMCWRAQKEIRDLANLMAQEVVKVDPALGKYLQAKCDKDGFCSEHNGCGKYPKRENK